MGEPIDAIEDVVLPPDVDLRGPAWDAAYAAAMQRKSLRACVDAALDALLDGNDMVALVRGDDGPKVQRMEAIDRAVWHEDDYGGRLVQGLSYGWTPAEGDSPVYRFISPQEPQDG